MSKTDRYSLDPVLVIVPAHGDATALGTLLPEATVRGVDAATGKIGSTGQAAARMAVAGQNVLVTVGVWAGLDIPIRWRHVVMPKAPYGPPTILDEHEVSRCVDSRNTAMRRFRQGLARGLRTPEAVCTLHLLDGRFDRAEFIRRIFAKYGGRCRIRGCVEPSALEAAHLGSKSG